MKILYISIHALREEGDDEGPDVTLSADKFLSTPSARRATEYLGDLRVIKEFLSTPSARRATRVVAGACLGLDISIHALREEGDRWRAASRSCPC